MRPSAESTPACRGAEALRRVAQKMARVGMRDAPHSAPPSAPVLKRTGARCAGCCAVRCDAGAPGACLMRRCALLAPLCCREPVRCARASLTVRACVPWRCADARCAASPALRWPRHAPCPAPPAALHAAPRRAPPRSLAAAARAPIRALKRRAHLTVTCAALVSLLQRASPLRRLLRLRPRARRRTAAWR
jgi:hypothetical protein